MPYAVERKNSKYAVVSKETGEVTGTYATKAKAESQVRLLYGVDNEMTPRGKKKKVTKPPITKTPRGEITKPRGRAKPPILGPFSSSEFSPYQKSPYGRMASEPRPRGPRGPRDGETPSNTWGTRQDPVSKRTLKRIALWNKLKETASTKPKRPPVRLEDQKKAKRSSPFPTLPRKK